MTEYNAEVLVDERFFCEGPCWHDGRFWFSDFFAHEVCSVDLDGEVRVELTLDGRPSGLGWLPDGRLLLVDMTTRRVLRREHDGSLVQHADLSGIATFHTNDMLVDESGRAYVGNFGFDLESTVGSLGIGGLLRAIATDPTPYVAKLALVAADGTVSVAAPDLCFPNGMALLDGGATFVVAQTFGLELTAFDRASDGTLSNRRVWAPLSQIHVAPDGICVDERDGIWVANAFGPMAVRVERGGVVTDTVTASRNVFACALGGPQGRHLLLCTAASGDAVAAEAPKGRLELVAL